MRGGTHDDRAAVGEFGHHVAVVVLLDVDDADGHAFVFKAGGDGGGHDAGGAPHGVVDDDGALLRLLFGKGAVGVEDVLAVVLAAPDEAVVGGDHFDVELQGSHKLKRLEDLRGEGQDDVVVVFLDRLFQHAAVVLIRKTFGGGDVLAEGVVADKELVFGDVGNHAVGPVQHTGFHEMDVPLADVDDVPGLDHFDGPASGVELGFHETLADGRRDDLLGLAALDELAQGPGVVFFGVVHDDVVDLVERHQLGEAAEHGSGVIVVHRVEHDVLLVADEIAVVGRAARGTAVAVEVALVVVDGSDPENIFRQFNGFHSDKILSGMFEVSTKTWGCDEARHTPYSTRSDEPLS